MELAASKRMETQLRDGEGGAQRRKESGKGKEILINE
jgi:hypothetical protein